ncbi:RNase H [Phytophthora megakarya]|uniref:RNase H n=1 Tax=Phytophthora megakarya TaxID=4795 RepID=A0A225VS64_9STRA|nr:RNase H [Phytophthora megakarya]
MKAQNSVSQVNTPVGWNGPAYAVAVGRRMGIFKTHQEAVRQSHGYSANSMKKFESYDEAVEFLDHHNWKKILPSQDNSGKLKVDRDEDQDFEADRPAQRRKTANASQQAKFLNVFCSGLQSTGSHEESIVESSCIFPTHPKWNIVKTVDPVTSVTRAGLLAVLDMLNRVAQEDPRCEMNVSIIALDPLLRTMLQDCMRNGWPSALENQDLLERIFNEKGSRVLRLGDVTDIFTWGNVSST